MFPCHVLYGAGPWTYTKLRPSTPVAHGNICFLRIWMYYRCRPRPAPPPLPPMAGCTPYQDWWATISFIRLDAGTNHLDPTVAVVWGNWDASVKIQCLHCLRSHILCLLPHSRRRRLCSKVSLGHLAGRLDQYPAVKSRLRMVRTDIRLPNRRIICIRRRGVQMNGSFWPFGEVDGLPVAWRFSSNLQASCNVVGQSLGYVAKKYH